MIGEVEMDGDMKPTPASDYINVRKVADKLAKQRWALEQAFDRIVFDNPLSYEDCLFHLTKKEKAQLEFVDWETYKDK